MIIDFIVGSMFLKLAISKKASKKIDKCVNQDIKDNAQACDGCTLIDICNDDNKIT